MAENGNGNGENGKLSARDLTRFARETIEDLTGRDVEAVTAMQWDGESWLLTVDVCELERIPNTTDVLASYVVQLDDGGGLLGYKRDRRYQRGRRGRRPDAWRRLPGRPEPQANLADILERVLDKGIVIAGDIQINLLDIELLTIKLRLLIASVDRARDMGIDWWEGDPALTRGAGGDGPAAGAGEPRAPRAARTARAAARGGERRWLSAACGHTPSRAPATRCPSGSPVSTPGTRPCGVEAGPLAALVSGVALAEYGAESLRRNLNDFQWLERVARAHEAVLEQALAGATLVPLRLCTIFEDEEAVRAMLRARAADLIAALDALAGREEWTVKLLADRAALERAARDDAPAPEVAAAAGSGAAYMLGRRRDREVREQAAQLAARLAEDVHARLRADAVDAVIGRPQNRDLSGHEGEMLLNAAYLVDREAVGRLRERVAELEEAHRGLGARLELRGPLPPYNFIPEAPA